MLKNGLRLTLRHSVASICVREIMSNFSENLWQINEFAGRAKVTVRTLQYYDRLGLLRPQRRNAKGFRLYSESEFARLQQILTLKFIGFSLAQIREILGQQEFNLAKTLQLQRKILEAQRLRLNFALEAISRAEKTFKENGETDWESFHKIIEVIDMEQNTDWTKKYYSDEAQKKVEARKNLWSPELQERVTRDWSELVQDIEAAMKDGTNPNESRAQMLAARWQKLLLEFTSGDKSIQTGLNKMYADKANWQTTCKKPFSDEVQNFIFEAIKGNSNQ